jgi:hypothetical protein
MRWKFQRAASVRPARFSRALARAAGSRWLTVPSLAALAVVGAGLAVVSPPAAVASVAAAVRVTAPADKYTPFNDVSCVSARYCVAVGDRTNSSGLLAEQWNGSKWALTTVKLPSGSTSGDLNSVSCASVTDCLAVGGWYSASSGGPLAELWNGKAWTAIKAPAAVPAGTTATPTLTSVSCPAARRCVAVGDDFNGDGFADVWNGAKVTAVKVPAPVKKTGVDLSGVSCHSAASCVAVGAYYGSGSTYGALSATWNGKAWRPAARSGLLALDKRMSLSAVSCAAATRCVAVGTQATSAGFRVYADSLNGTTWTVTKLSPIPGDDFLQAVSCASPTNCLAVGASGTQWPYINTGVSYSEAWNGKAWSVRKVPAPPNTGDAGSQLSGVQCLKPTSCMAVGEAGNYMDGFSAYWDGKAWKLTAGA